MTTESHNLTDNQRTDYTHTISESPVSEVIISKYKLVVSPICYFGISNTVVS